MRLAYKYRIYPNQEQIKQLEKTFSFCCFLYNSALEERISFYKKTRKSISYNSQAAELPAVKDVFEDQTDSIYSQTLQATLKQLDFAYKGFFSSFKGGKRQSRLPAVQKQGSFQIDSVSSMQSQ